MKIQDIRGIAKTWNVDVKVGRSKMDMIRDIQVSGRIFTLFSHEGCVQRALPVERRLHKSQMNMATGYIYFYRFISLRQEGG